VRNPSTAHSLHSAPAHAPKSHSYEVSALDFTSLENVRTFAASINERVAHGSLPPLRALVPHASVQLWGPPEYTPDGTECTLAVNYLANFLARAAAAANHGPASTAASSTYRALRTLRRGILGLTKPGRPKFLYTDFGRLVKGKEDWREEKLWLWGWKWYAFSKVLMLMFTFVSRM
jgi:hypothetical protein